MSETRDQLETKYYKLEKLVKWEHAEEVNEMLLQGVSPHKVSAWCKERGFAISHPKLYQYKGMLQTAITRNVTIERLLGIGVPRRSPIQLMALGMSRSENMVKNEMEVLDRIIQKGMDVLLMPGAEIKPEQALRAIELKNKLTGGSHGGMTMHGLDVLRELEQAKFMAVVEVVQKYLPEDKLGELETAIQEAEANFYRDHAPHLLEEYEKASQDDIVVTDTQF